MRVGQMKIDVGYADFSELESFWNSIMNLNENSEFKVKVMPQQFNSEDMTEHYLSDPDIGWMKMHRLISVPVPLDWGTSAELTNQALTRLAKELLFNLSAVSPDLNDDDALEADAGPVQSYIRKIKELQNGNGCFPAIENLSVQAEIQLFIEAVGNQVGVPALDYWNDEHL